MNSKLAEYLKKFETLLPTEVKVRNAVISSIEQVVHIKLDRKSVRVQGTNVFIQGSASLKSEIAMKQKKILMNIQENHPGIGITKLM